MKRLKLLLIAVLLTVAAVVVPRPADAFPCWYVCSYGATEYCYYGDYCVPHCCRYDDWECLNPCAP